MLFDRLFSIIPKTGKTEPKIRDSEMNNVVNSMFLCAPIYDRLKVKCHPDRFIGETEKAHAENLFQELQKCKYNYEKLLEIELQINDFLEKNSSK